MARRKTLRSLEDSVLMSAGASLVAVVAMGFLVHALMWARVPSDEAASQPAKRPSVPVRISSKTLAA